MQDLQRDKTISHSLQARAKKTLSGMTKRAYLDFNGNLLSSASELAVARILSFAGKDYAYKKPIMTDGKRVVPTFATSGGYIVVDDKGEGAEIVLELKKAFPKKQVLHIARAAKASSLQEIGAPITSFLVDDETETDRLGSIFVDDPSFAFDYSHILPWTKKCSVLHGHTSAVMVELVGQTRKGMIVDFGEVKQIVKSTISEMDHKLFISRKYLVREDSKHYQIRFNGPNGEFELKVPKSSTFLLQGEATIENLADVVLRLLAPRMPNHVQGLGIYIYEGLNKGSHIMASLKGI